MPGPYDYTVYDSAVFDTDSTPVIPDTVNLEDSTGRVLQVSVPNASIDTFRSKLWVEDIAEFEFDYSDTEPPITYPVKNLQLKNPILDFVVGYSTKRVSPYNASPWDGAVDAAGDGTSIQPGYEATKFTISSDGGDIYYLIREIASGDFLLLDKDKQKYFPYDPQVYGTPVHEVVSVTPYIDGSPSWVGEERIVNPYFSSIGRATTDLFPDVLNTTRPIVSVYNDYKFISSNLQAQVVQPFYEDNGVTYAGSTTKFTRVTTLTGPQQYKVNATGLYTFHSSDRSKYVWISYKYQGAIPATFAGAVLPVDPLAKMVDESQTGVPPNPSTYSWTYVSTSVHDVPTAPADSIVDSIPIETPGTGYAVGDVGSILGGTGARYWIKELEPGLDGIPKTVGLQDTGSGYSNATVNTTAVTGSGSGLRLTITVQGSDRNKPVTLLANNPQSPKVWDLVKGGYHEAISIQSSAGKYYLVPMKKTSTNPTTGPTTLKPPLATVHVDNPTLEASLVSMLGGVTVPPSSMALGYSVEDNSWGLFIPDLDNASSDCSPLNLGLVRGVAYNFNTRFQGNNFYYDCYVAHRGYRIAINYSKGSGAAPGGSSAARNGNICDSVADLADAMLAAGADPADLPALANVLAGSINPTFSTTYNGLSQNFPSWIQGALMQAAVRAGATESLVIAIPAAKEIVEGYLASNLNTLFSQADLVALLNYAFNIPPKPSTTVFSNNFNLSARQSVTIATTPPVVIQMPRWVGPTPTAAQGFVNVNAGVNPLPINDTTNPTHACEWNIFNQFYAYMLPLGTNIWWYWGPSPDYSQIPIPVYVPNNSPTPNPGPPPTGQFPGYCDNCTPDLNIQDVTPLR